MFRFASAALALVVITGCAGSATSSPAHLLETGSSLAYPLMNAWVEAYQKVNPGVQITTQSTGSGTGISQAISGIAQIGASDAYIPDALMRRTPMANIPLAISAQLVNYNLPGLNDVHLNLSGPILAGIYEGVITNWRDAAIRAANPALAARLPNRTIVPIYRSDGSGDTFLFSQYLSFTTPSWMKRVGYGTSISWPAVAGGVGATGNPGMVQTCSNTAYSIAYIGMSFLSQTNAAKLGYAALRNRAGRYVLPTPRTVAAAAAAKTLPSDARVSLVYAPGMQSYPLVNYEYAIVNPAAANAATRPALVKFLSWAVDPQGGQQARFLEPAHFLPLPAHASALSRTLLAQIK